MDPQIRAMRVALEAQKEVKRQMEESLRDDFVAFVDKVKERTMLATNKQDMLDKEAPKAKLIDKFMVFTVELDNGDVETVQSFDEKAAMDMILTMMDGGDDGGLAGLYGTGLPGLGLEEKGTFGIDTVVATVKTDGEFAGDSVPEIKLLGHEEKVAVNNDGNRNAGKEEEGDQTATATAP